MITEFQAANALMTTNERTPVLANSSIVRAAVEYGQIVYLLPERTERGMQCLDPYCRYRHTNRNTQLSLLLFTTVCIKELGHDIQVLCTECYL